VALAALVGCQGPVASTPPAAQPGQEHTAPKVASEHEPAAGDKDTASLATPQPAEAVAESKADAGPAPATDITPADEAVPVDDVAGNATASLPDLPRERFLLLTRDGPLVIDLILKIDDEPYAAAFERVVDKALAEADTDGNGQVGWTEMLDNPRFAYGQYGNLTPEDEGQRGQLIETYDNNRNGLVERDELPRFLSRNVGNSQPFSLRSSNEYRDDNRSRSPVRRLLDRDHDGAITDAEMDQVPTLLFQRDADDDEILTAADFKEQLEPMQPEMSNRRRLTAPDTAIALHERTRWPGVLYALQEMYAYGERIGPDDVPLVPQLVEQLDANQNQLIDATEVATLKEVPPHLVLEVSFYNRARDDGAAGPQLQLLSSSDELQAAVAQGQQHPTRCSLRLAGEEVEFFVSDDPALGSAPELVRSQFAMLDRDQNGYLEESEYAGQILAFNLPFRGLDPNGDGMVYESEAVAVLELRQAVPRAQIRARAADQEDALFTALDTTGDGRLTAREIHGAPALLRELDRDGDGRLQSHEIPGTMAVGFIRGGNPQQDNQLLVVPAPPVKDDLLPRWFRGMDSNGDGDVSPREFLGSREKFEQLDTDADGFITPAEAATLEPTPTT